MILLTDLFALATVLVAVIRIAGSDTDRWAHGGRSKAAWILLALWWSWPTHLGVLPLGALAAIWYTRHLQSKPRRWNDDGLDVPFAEGIPVPFERRSQETVDSKEES